MAHENPNGRLETFCDGVFAIALTLLILEIRAPVAEQIRTADDLWMALRHLMPSMMAFLLSFAIILISWFNHHGAMKWIDKSSHRFVYANGFMLLTVVLVPFPTALLAEFAFTPAAVPAVVAYSVVNLLQGLSWILFAHTTLRPRDLTRSAYAKTQMELVRKQASIASLIYLVCVVAAFWFPMTVTATLALIYVNWLVFGLRAKEPA